VICTVYQMVYGWPNRQGWDGMRMWQVYWKSTGAYMLLTWKPETKRPLRKQKRKWERLYYDGCRGNLECGRGLKWKGDWRAVVKTVMNIQVSKSGKLLASWKTFFFLEGI
jgi:hypothetical protein